LVLEEALPTLIPPKRRTGEGVYILFTKHFPGHFFCPPISASCKTRLYFCDRINPNIGCDSDPPPASPPSFPEGGPGAADTREIEGSEVAMEWRRRLQRQVPPGRPIGGGGGGGCECRKAARGSRFSARAPISSPQASPRPSGVIIHGPGSGRGQLFSRGQFCSLLQSPAGGGGFGSRNLHFVSGIRRQFNHFNGILAKIPRIPQDFIFFPRLAPIPR